MKIRWVIRDSEEVAYFFLLLLYVRHEWVSESVSFVSCMVAKPVHEEFNSICAARNSFSFVYDFSPLQYDMKLDEFNSCSVPFKLVGQNHRLFYEFPSENCMNKWWKWNWQTKRMANERWAMNQRRRKKSIVSMRYKRPKKKSIRRRAECETEQ